MAQGWAEQAQRPQLGIPSCICISSERKMTGYPRKGGRKYRQGGGQVKWVLREDQEYLKYFGRVLADLTPTRSSPKEGVTTKTKKQKTKHMDPGWNHVGPSQRRPHRCLTPPASHEVGFTGDSLLHPLLLWALPLPGLCPVAMGRGGRE